MPSESGCGSLAVGVWWAINKATMTIMLMANVKLLEAQSKHGW
jgi:hypothetical protein